METTATNLGNNEPPPGEGSERRIDPRYPIERACRIASGGRWVCARGTTLNASRHGVLVCVETDRQWEPGDTLSLAVDWRGNELLGPASVVEGKVVRVERPNRFTQRLGVMLYPNQSTPTEPEVRSLSAHAQPPELKPTGNRPDVVWAPLRAA